MEHGVLKLANGLDPSRVRSIICSTCPADPEMASRLEGHVGLGELQRREGNDPAVIWRVLRLLRQVRPDVLHTHAWGTLIEGLVAGRAARVPAIVHGEHGTLQLRPYQRRLQRWAWRRVDRVLSVSSRLAERMAHDVGFPLETIHVLRNGVDLARFEPKDRRAARTALGLRPDRLTFGTVGRLVEVKNQQLLVRAVARLVSDGEDCQLVICGEGPLRHALTERAAALGMQERVCLPGYREDVERVMAAFDVFALTSHSEGMSNTILEAMASGLPVVATRVGGADELVDDGATGLLVPAGEIDELVGALRALAEDASRRWAMGRAGRARAHDEFSLGAMLARYQDLYVQLATRRQAWPSGTFLATSEDEFAVIHRATRPTQTPQVDSALEEKREA